MPPYRSSKYLRRTLFGFDHRRRHKAVDQFRELIGLDKVQFSDIQEKLRDITQKYLEIDKIATCQSQAIDKALEDLQFQLPALFKRGNIEQRLFFAMRTILVIHNARRKSQAKNNQRSAKPSLTERMAANLASILKGTQAPRMFASPAPARCKVRPSSSGFVKVKSPPLESPASASRSLNPRQKCSLALPPQTPSFNASPKTFLDFISGPGSSNGQVSPPSHARHGSSHIDESKAIKVENPSSSTPLTTLSTMMADLSTSTSCGDTQLRGDQIHSVHHFLEAAIPPMTHLLHQFMEFGCVSEEFLFAVSGWSPEAIGTFLKRLPPGPGGRALTEMEINILTYHFESYFLA